MPIRLFDRVKQKTATSGSGTITLGSSVNAFLDFSGVFNNGDQTFYVIENLTSFEIGIGTYNSGTLSRNTVFKSSNNDQLLDLPGDANTYVFVTYPASGAVFNTGDGNLIIQNRSRSGIAFIDSDNNITTNTGLVFNSTSGYLGIGTGDPQVSLHVRGNVQIENYTSFYNTVGMYRKGYNYALNHLSLYRPATVAEQNSGIYTRVGGLNTGGASNGGNKSIYLFNELSSSGTNDGAYGKYINNLCIFPGGNVGINFNLENGSTPAARLHVRTSGAGNGNAFTISNSGSQYLFTVKDNGNTNLFGNFESSGNGYFVSGLGVGVAVPSAKVEINTVSSSTKGLIIKGAAAQSANLFEWLDSSNNILGYIDSSGNIGSAVNKTSANTSLYLSRDSFNRILMESYRNTTAGSHNILRAVAARGTSASPSYLNEDEIIFEINARTHNNDDIASMVIRADSNHTSGNYGTEILFLTTPTGSNTAQQRLGIGADGNVGIGNNAEVANYLLHVKGTGYFESGIRYPDGVVQTIAYTGQGSTSSTTGVASGVAFFNNSNLLTTSTGLVFNNTSGYLGIGIVNPEYPLHVSGTIYSNNAKFFSNIDDENVVWIKNDNSGSNAYCGVRFDNNTGVMGWILAGSTTYGLGDTAQNRLEIQSSTRAEGLNLRANSNGQRPGDIRFFTKYGPVEVMRIDLLGNVGIGTTLPSAKLQIDTTGHASTKGLVIKGAAAQSANLVEIQDNAATNLFSIENLGAIRSAPIWNSSGVVLTGILMNVTDTASANDSLLIQLQKSGSNRLTQTKHGLLTVEFDTTQITQGLRIRGTDGNNYWNIGNIIDGFNSLVQIAAGTTPAISNHGLINLGAGYLHIVGGPTTKSIRTFGDFIIEPAALGSTGVFEQRNGTNAQTFRLYNTYVDSTGSYERGKFAWESNILRIGTEKGSVSGSARSLELQTSGVTRLTIGADGNITSSNSINISDSSKTISIGTVYGPVISHNGFDSYLSAYRDNGNANLRLRSGSSATYKVITQSAGGLAIRNYTDTADANITAGSGTFNGQLQINTTSSSTKGLIVKGAAAQSANLTEWKNSSDTTLSFINNSGQYILYHNYIDDSNYSSSLFDFSSNTGNLTIGTKSNGTGTELPIIFKTSSSLFSFKTKYSQYITISSNNAVATINSSNNLLKIDSFYLDSSSSPISFYPDRNINSLKIFGGQPSSDVVTKPLYIEGASCQASAVANPSGGNLIIAGGRGRDSGIGGIIIFQLAPAVSGSAALNTLQNVGQINFSGIQINGTGTFSSGVRYPDGITQTVAYNNNWSTITGDYTVTNNDYGIFVNVSGNILITIPSGIIANGKKFIFKSISNYTITISGESTTIDGGPSYVLYNIYEHVSLVSNGLQWLVI